MKSMRFLADEMHGNLCRWLRFLGYDTTYAKDYESKYGIPVSDDQLINECIEDHRILITNDMGMIKKIEIKLKKLLDTNPEFNKGYEILKAETNSDIILPYVLVNSEDIYANLKFLKERFGIKFDYDDSLVRCSNCNFILKKISNKEEYQNRIPESVFSYHTEFWICSNPKCGKLYWKGIQFERNIQKLKKIEFNE